MRETMRVAGDGVRVVAPDAGTDPANGKQGLDVTGGAIDGKGNTMEVDEDGLPVPYGTIDQDLARPPLVFGCERLPFIIWMGVVAFLLLVVFGITVTGVIAAVAMAVIGVWALRGIAEDDPFFFAVWWEASKYPKHLPRVADDPMVDDLDFVGYEDMADKGILGAIASTSLFVQRMLRIGQYRRRSADDSTDTSSDG